MAATKGIFEASLQDLSTALAEGHLTSVDLVAKYLLRIATYDTRHTMLNSIPLLNEEVFTEAARADDKRFSTESCHFLNGIPFTVKDSFKVRGLTVANGSEAFENLMSNEDAFTVSALRGVGAVLIGKTNMCPMAYGGMIRGVYGRSESPYNQHYLPAAFGSGSSHGSAVSVAASFAAFGLGEETVSSGRSPASNNGLVAYTPSRGLISVRGNWPLYATCDVVVPQTRSVDDMLSVLGSVTVEDPVTKGDFWRDQPFISLRSCSPEVRKPFHFTKDVNYLRGKRLVVPKKYIYESENGPYVSNAVEALFRQAQADLHAIGATVEVVDEVPVLEFPFQQWREQIDSSSLQLPDDWNSVERGSLIAQAWESFLRDNNDPALSSLADIDHTKLFPQLPADDLQVRFTEPTNAIQWSNLASYATCLQGSSDSDRRSIYDTPKLDVALKSLEAMRKHHLEDWMDKCGYDLVVFPAAGDVARADADVDYGGAEHAWREGVKYSHGNRTLRHLGIPSVTVPMGMLAQQRMPMGLTFLARAYQDADLLQAAHAFEQRKHGRMPPPLTPPLLSDTINLELRVTSKSPTRPTLSVSHVSVTQSSEHEVYIEVEGSASAHVSSQHVETVSDHLTNIQVYADSTELQKAEIRIYPTIGKDGKMSTGFCCGCLRPGPAITDLRNQVKGRIARDSVMIMILARDGQNGWPAGYLKVVHRSDFKC